MKKGFLIILLNIILVAVYSQKILPIDDFKEFNNGFAAVKKGEYWAFIDTSGNYVTDFNIPHKSFYKLKVVDSVYVTWTYSLGYTHLKDQEVLLEPKYKLIPFSEGVGMYVDKDYVSLDQSGYITRGADKQFTVRFINNRGDEIFSKNVVFGYESSVTLRPFVNGHCVLKLNDSIYSILDKQGLELGTVNCFQIGDFNDGLIKVQHLNEYGETKWGFVDKNGKLVIDYKFTNEPSDFENGFAAIKGKNSKFGFINKAGELVLDLKYREVFSFQDNKCIVRLDYNDYDSRTSTGYALIDENGTILKKYGKIKITSDVVNGMVRFESNYDKIGYMNTDGEVLVPPVYRTLSLFNSGRAYGRLKKDNQYIEGFINTRGDFVLVKGEEVLY